MRIPRLFVDQPLAPDSEVEANKDLTHYLLNVLRAKVGQGLILFNGDACDYPSEIITISKKSVRILVNSAIQLNVESPLEIHLMQAISKGERMDFAIQKAVELGVTEITPVMSEYCNVKLSAERWQKKVEQWQKIVINACEQCLRNVVPTVNAPISFNEMLALRSEAKKVILSPESSLSLSQLSKLPKGFIIAIGPEGGFSEQELYSAEQRGFISCHAGPRILRTETATVSALSILQSLFGDF